MAGLFALGKPYPPFSSFLSDPQSARRVEGIGRRDQEGAGGVVDVRYVALFSFLSWY